MANPIETLKQLGMRQADIARELGVTPGHVQRMCDGERPLRKAHLVKLRSLITARVSALNKVIRQIND